MDVPLNSYSNCGSTMPKIFYSSVIPASIDQILATIRDFKELPSWNPSFSDCSIE